ncbi:HD domain-containing protein [Clostridium sp. MSJ-8]|uniref:HD domain-containing protein n=1 Tax=Clostridium sp. MSJ-8 TaxID=2841510 RepID=UPI001C0E988D|nr:HD domain-containing protein [Clostridium sp. MSJ-8]MBU5487857.1 HD domain-containing protein [Clostridium sp. MSJ-8]
MNKVNEILHNKKYTKYLNELNELEQDREFCKHTMEHFLDVSRIAYIKVLENNLNYSKDIIYAIGLLHDIGRVLQYNKGIPHDEGSVIIARDILSETSYTEEEVEIILRAIDSHRRKTVGELENIIYTSDKESRNCFMCLAEKECYWSKDKKNFDIII